MKYYLGQARAPLDLEQKDVIGSGGEAVIYGYRGKALKIYRDPSRERSQKLDHFFKQKFNFPANIIAPEEPIYDKPNGGQIIGFQMRLLPAGCKPLAMLMRRDYCDSNGVTTLMKVKIFISLLKGLSNIHKQAGVVVGDLNDQNEIFADLATGEVYWIDVDSWQIGDFPCMVGTEDYISPDLYGQDLSKKPLFKPEHDYYSFVVLMFRTLIMAHPFSSGIHPKFLSLFDRAKNGLTVLDSSVRYPKKARPKEILTDELLSLLQQYLKRQRQDAFPLAELEAYGELLTECPSCHLWYPASRSNCPGCAAKTIATTKVQAKIAGCVCDILMETAGRILWHQLAEDSLCVLADEDGMTVLYRKPKNGSLARQELFKTLPEAEYAIFGDVLIVCPDPSADSPELMLIDIESAAIKGIAKTSTNRYSGGKAVFASSGRRLYRLAGNSLMSGDLFGDYLADRQVMEVIGNQSIIFVATNPETIRNQEVILVAQRVFGDLLWSVAIGDSEGKKYKHFNINLSQLDNQESLIDASIRFGAKTVLILRHTRQRGANYVRIDRVNIDDGQIIDSKKSKTADAGLFQDIHGKGFTDGAVLHATEDGIVMQNLSDDNTIILPGTDNYVSGGEQLVRYGSGVLVITSDRIIHLKPEPKK